MAAATGKKSGATKPATKPAADAAAGDEAPKTKAKAASKKGATKPPAAEADGPADVAAGSSPAVDPLALPNGRTLDMGAVRKAIKVYSPKTRIPADDAVAVATLRQVVGARLAEVPAEDHMLCGEQDDPTTGCREMATGDVNYCPYCGDEGLPEDEAPPAPGVVDDAGTAPANATEAGLVAMKAELDEAVTRFDGYRRDLVENAYDIGLTLRDIRDRELWKASGASSLKDFMEKELSISRTSGYRYMALTEEYDRKTFLEIGPRKLSLISGIDDKESRDAALDAAKAGATTRDVEALAGGREGKSRETPAREGKSGSSGSSGSAPSKSKGSEITLLAKVNGKSTVIPFRGAESGRPLKHYKVGAYGEFQISDDVVLRVAFKDDKEGNHEGISIAFVRCE